MRLSLTIHPLLLLGLCTAVGQGATIFDNFNDGNDTSPLWTFIDVTDQGGGGIGSRGFGPNNLRYQLSGPATASVRTDFTIVDGEVRSEISNWNPSVSVGSSVGILARFDPNTLSGYFLSIDADGSPNLNLVKLVNGQPAGGSEGLPKVYNANGTYILQLLVAGAKITGRIYEKGSPANTLVDEVAWTDPSPFTAGVTGCLVANDEFPESFTATTALFDNFLATDGTVARPTLSNPCIVENAFEVNFGTEPGRPYLLEYKNSITDLNWSSLTLFAPESTAGTKTATDPLTGGNRFFQIRVVDDSP